MSALAKGRNSDILYSLSCFNLCHVIQLAFLNVLFLVLLANIRTRCQLCSGCHTVLFPFYVQCRAIGLTGVSGVPVQPRLVMT